MTKKPWSWSTGGRGGTVRLYERGQTIYLAVFDPTLRDGKGGVRRRSLGHADRDLAKKEARRIAGVLADDSAAASNPTIGYVFDLYRHHELPGKKPATKKWIQQYLHTWEGYLTSGFRIRQLSMREWEAFKRDRRSGAIDAWGRSVPEGQRRPIAVGSVNLNLDAISIVLNWATRWRTEHGPLLERSPVWRFPYFDDVNPNRSIWTHDRFLAVLKAAETVTMQVEWSGKRRRLPSYLADILFIAEGTGRRIGAVSQLRAEDLRLTEGSSGKIKWPADTDKSGKSWLTAVTPAVRARLVKVLRDRPAVGPVPLFPAPRDASQPVDRDTLAVYVKRALKAAGLPRLDHDSFHGLRRKFATERKHLPDVDVAKAGGWRSVNVMKRSYQLADEVGVLDAIQSPRRLREKGGA